MGLPLFWLKICLIDTKSASQRQPQKWTPPSHVPVMSALKEDSPSRSAQPTALPAVFNEFQVKMSRQTPTPSARPTDRASMPPRQSIARQAASSTLHACSTTRDGHCTLHGSDSATEVGGASVGVDG
jgi:hypothetical protein